MKKYIISGVIIMLLWGAELSAARGKSFRLTRIIQLPALHRALKPERRPHHLIAGFYPVSSNQWLVGVYSHEGNLKTKENARQDTREYVKNPKFELFLMNSLGEIQARSKQPLPFSSMSAFAPNRFFYLPSIDDCTFGFLEVVLNKIICLDGTLEKMKTLRVPLDWVQAGTVLYGEEGYELWVFGGKSETSNQETPDKPKAVQKNRRLSSGMKYWMTLNKINVDSKTLGAIYPFEKSGWTSISTSPLDVLRRIQKVALDREARRIHLSRTGMYWTPVLGKHPDGGIELLVEVNEKVKHPSRPPRGIPEYRWLSGRRFFFLVELFPWGLGKVRRLPLEIHFWDRYKVKLDEQNAILWMPHFYRPSPGQQAYRIRSNRILLHFHTYTILSKSEVVREEGITYQREPSVETFAILPLNGDPPEFTTEETIQKEIEKQDQFNVLTGLVAFDGQRKLYFSGFKAQWIKNKNKSYRLNRIPVIYELVYE